MSGFNEAFFLEHTQQGLKQLLIPFTTKQLEQLHTFSVEFFKWNGVHNLSAISSDEEFLSAHVMDSLGAINPILKAVKMGLLPSQSKIADLGVGGGFPSMLLAIFLPEFEFYLVEAIRKKTAFLQHVKGRLKLSNVKVVEQRIELFAKEQPKSMDATISRAFTELKHFIDYSVPLIKEGGIMFAMKSQKIAFELESMSKDYQVIFNEELDIPYLDAYRCILAIQTVRKLES
jgi:16S rRNA (guanine527-N7)-methyltransferase